MSTWISPGGDFVLEGVGKGHDGFTGGGPDLEQGGGGGEYARAKITTSAGDSYSLGLSTGGGSRILGPGSVVVLLANDSTGQTGGTGGTGTILHDGGTGSPSHNASGFPGNYDGGGGGGPAYRFGIGVTPATGFAGGVTRASDLVGGFGSPLFDGPAGDGIGPGAGGGGKGFSSSGTPGVGQGGWLAIWAIADWNGDPDDSSTGPSAGTTPVSNLGPYDPAPIATARSYAFFM